MMRLELRDVVQVRGTGHRAVTVLRGASLSARAGECLMLEGPSGSGKTTLLAVAAGLLTPSAGEVVADGLAVHGLAYAARCRWRASAVGFVFQRANLLSGLTALDNVTLAAQLAGVPGGAARQRAWELLGQLDVRGLARRFPRELSGGEEQRVAVARALVHRPGIVLADEPTGGLDRETAQPVVQLLTTLAREAGCAIVLATHDRELSRFATRRVHLQDGCLHDG